MSKLSITKDSGEVSVGPLAADTDFNIVAGICTFTTETFSGTNTGIPRACAGIHSTWQVKAGETVIIKTPTQAVIMYEEL